MYTHNSVLHVLLVLRHTCFVDEQLLPQPVGAQHGPTTHAGEKLDNLVAKSNDLGIASQLFYKQAKSTNSCCKMM